MSSAARDGRTILANAAWVLAGVLVFWSFGYTIMRGSDLWWHVAGGHWMVENGALWVREPFAFTAEGRWWINDAWLADVLFHFWSEAFGIETLVFWKWGLIVVTWLVVFRLLARLGGERITAFAVATFGLAVAAPFLDVRPQLYSFLGFALLLDACVGRRPPAWLPLLFLAGANLHAAFLVGLIALPALLVAAWLADRSDGRRLLLLGLACVGASLLNPQGAEVVLRPMRYAFDASSPFRTLGEWKPPFEPGGIQSWLFPWAIGVFAVAGVAALALQGRDRQRLRFDVLVSLAIGLLTLAMALRSRRFVPFFAIGMAPVVASVAGGLAKGWLERLPALAGPAVAAALGAVWLWPYPLGPVAFDFLTARYEFPVETSNFIDANRLGGKVFNYYNWGGYLQLRHGERMKLFIDGRADTVYEDRTFVDYMTVLHQKPGWQELIRASGAEWVLWPADTDRVAQTLAASGEWALVYRDHKSVLLRRADLAPLADLRPTPDSAYRRISEGWMALLEGRYAEAEVHYARALEMAPHLPNACTGFAQAQAFLGRFDAGREAIRRCETVFPGQGRVEWYERFVASVQARGGQR